MLQVTSEQKQMIEETVILQSLKENGFIDYGNTSMKKEKITMIDKFKLKALFKTLGIRNSIVVPKDKRRKTTTNVFIGEKEYAIVKYIDEYSFRLKVNMNLTKRMKNGRKTFVKLRKGDIIIMTEDKSGFVLTGRNGKYTNDVYFPAHLFTNCIEQITRYSLCQVD